MRKSMVLVLLALCGLAGAARAQDHESKDEFSFGHFSAGGNFALAALSSADGDLLIGLDLVRVDRIDGSHELFGLRAPFGLTALREASLTAGGSIDLWVTWDARAGVGLGLAGAGGRRLLGLIGGVGTDRWASDDFIAPAALYLYGGAVLSLLNERGLGIGGSLTLHARTTSSSTQEVRAEGWLTLFNLRFGLGLHSFRDGLFETGPVMAYAWTFSLGVGFGHAR